MPNKKTKAKPPPNMKEKKRNGYKWSMQPALHGTVARLLKKDNLSFTFHENDDEHACIESYDTNIMGQFKCRNEDCGANGWSSKKIAITIRQYPGRRYNARVYHQRCQGCNRLSRPFLDDSYGERIAYRLKKWSGLEVEKPPFSDESKGPHQSSLCEGCKAGHCSEMRYEYRSYS